MQKMQEIALGEVFCFRGELDPKLRTREGYVDMRFRTEHTDRMDDEAEATTPEMLCVILHRQEIMDWVEAARAWFIPPDLETDGTTENQEAA